MRGACSTYSGAKMLAVRAQIIPSIFKLVALYDYHGRDAQHQCELTAQWAHAVDLVSALAST